MRRQRGFWAGLIVLCAGLGAASHAAAQGASLSVDFVDPTQWVKRSRVTFFVNLLDAEYRVISGLSAEDFDILQGSEREKVEGTIEVEIFREITDGVAVAILMAGHNTYVQDFGHGIEGEPPDRRLFERQKSGVQNFLSKLAPDDRAAVFVYDQKGPPRMVEPFTNGFSDAARRVAGMTAIDASAPGASAPGRLIAPGFFSHLLDIIENQFGAEDDLPRRKILILMSDAVDVNSGNPQRIDQRVKDIEAAARDYGVQVYSIGFSLNDKENLRYLKAIAAKTGGAYRELKDTDIDTIPDAWAGLAEEIKKQYVISITSEDLEGDVPYRFRVAARTGGQTLEAEYDRDVKLPEKPFNWKRLLVIVGVVVGSLIVLVILFKVIGGILRARSERVDMEPVAQEYTGPSKGRLVINSGPHAGEEYPLTKDMMTIGSMPGNDICFEMDDACSKRHAGIKIDEMRYELADFGSTNGTYVNGRKINKQFLRDSDRIKVGGTELTFHVK